jgi:hypothetical protein
MRDYRENSPSLATGNNEEPSTRATGRSTAMPTYFALAAEYGLEESDDIGFEDSRTTVQTVEQEYQSYIMGVLSSKTIDILHFWEVS